MEHLGRTTKTPRHGWKASYRCECGTEFETLEYYVKIGDTKSCGCLNLRKTSERFRTHGMKGTQTYRSWVCMKQRCSNPRNKDYKWYGGRGISYDPRWEAFEEFLLDMGESPGKGWSLDKIDNDGDYCKANCQWLTLSDNVKKMLKKRWEK